MILGMTTATFTLVYVLISLAGIGSGFVVVYGLLTGKRLETDIRKPNILYARRRKIRRAAK